MAHQVSPRRILLDHPLWREEKEELESKSLSPGASFSRGSGQRSIPESPDRSRTCFEVDRDRILHRSNAFRRLAGKTQVFIFPDDHMRNRLTHALEVTQIARAISSQLRLNVPLTEAIALGHDCGHGPFGHASEDALSQFIDEGFDHAPWGASVVLAPLNLTEETLDGIANHSWSRPAPSTPEGEVVSWADRIAYVCHDFEDAVSAGIVHPQDLPKDVLALLGPTRSGQINGFITNLVTVVAKAGTIAMTQEYGQALASFRLFNYSAIYNRAASVEQAKAVNPLIAALVEHFAQFPDAISSKPLQNRTPNITSGDSTAELPGPKTDQAYRASVGYVAGMTDRYAVKKALATLDWKPDRLPRGIDIRG
ncbi:MAG: HD domain-containing protein [Acidimicrobiaceae bacterium]|nr:HD domain-containing protein [Acidimicrobiaceae bacterium]